MNSDTKAEPSSKRQSEESNYSLCATLDDYELKELSVSRMAKWLRKRDQNTSSAAEPEERN